MNVCWYNGLSKSDDKFFHSLLKKATCFDREKHQVFLTIHNRRPARQSFPCKRHPLPIHGRVAVSVQATSWPPPSYPPPGPRDILWCFSTWQLQNTLPHNTWIRWDPWPKNAQKRESTPAAVTEWTEKNFNLLISTSCHFFRPQKHGFCFCAWLSQFRLWSCISQSTCALAFALLAFDWFKRLNCAHITTHITLSATLNAVVHL